MTGIRFTRTEATPADRANAQAYEALRQISEALWPNGRADAEWTPTTLDRIALAMTRAGYGPNAQERHP